MTVLDVDKELGRFAQTAKIRWQEMMSYLQALVYHVRNVDEHEGLFAHIRQTVRNERLRREVATMKETMAEWLRKEGHAEGQVKEVQSILLEELRERFGDLDDEVTTTVETCSDRE